MALRRIVKEPDEILRKKCRPVESFDDKLCVLLDDMKETMRDAEGVGLAAPQVGILKRVAVVEVGDFYLEMVNPEIVEREGEQIGIEGCLSVENYNCNVARPAKLKLKAFDRFGKQFEIEVEGYIARACCHEIDHLDGILFTDRFYSEYKPEGEDDED
ncbi:MAG TPA: peptide deformylase [Eubacteriales bacterium]|nr:peptide deformylase [Eubacteriales bacterium]